jgi:hypothetical protein
MLWTINNSAHCIPITTDVSFKSLLPTVKIKKMFPKGNYLYNYTFRHLFFLCLEFSSPFMSAFMSHSNEYQHIISIDTFIFIPRISSLCACSCWTHTLNTELSTLFTCFLLLILHIFTMQNHEFVSSHRHGDHTYCKALNVDAKWPGISSFTALHVLFQTWSLSKELIKG